MRSLQRQAKAKTRNHKEIELCTLYKYFFNYKSFKYNNINFKASNTKEKRIFKLAHYFENNYLCNYYQTVSSTLLILKFCKLA